ncbi:MAG: hypothetical protein BWZ07_02661 [Alphaproteobacteria bacterium ADurb.BinA280]|nr:MAG: hypothetical protein BWZ07_02661 [Alphaproteobacteria bacterium ADurb.BinA280]
MTLYPQQTQTGMHDHAQQPDADLQPRADGRVQNAIIEVGERTENQPQRHDRRQLCRQLGVFCGELAALQQKRHCGLGKQVEQYRTRQRQKQHETHAIGKSIRRFPPFATRKMSTERRVIRGDHRLRKDLQRQHRKHGGIRHGGDRSLIATGQKVLVDQPGQHGTRRADQQWQQVRGWCAEIRVSQIPCRTHTVTQQITVAPQQHPGLQKESAQDAPHQGSHTELPPKPDDRQQHRDVGEHAFQRWQGKTLQCIADCRQN